MTSQHKSRSGSAKNVLHEPVAPYFASVYNTLVSVVQAFAIGGLLIHVSQQPDISASIIAKSIITLLVIGLIWHRYITHDQYISWRLDMFDTLVPLGFAWTQYWLITNIRNEAGSTFDFSLWLTITTVWGFLAYLNSFIKHKKTTDQTKDVLREHFRLEDEDFSVDFLKELNEFHGIVLLTMAVTALIYGALSIILCFSQLNENIQTMIVCMCAGSLLFILFFKFDLRWKLNNSTRESIKKYKW